MIKSHIEALVDGAGQKKYQEVLIYGFKEPDSAFDDLFDITKKEWMNANEQSIRAWMKGECAEPSVLVAHADTCRGFEWPTVFTISM